MNIKINKQNVWEEMKNVNSKGYGKVGIEFTETWANIMEKYIATGSTIVECAAKAADEADVVGISPFMYGLAVMTLSEVWEHGEILREWHNNKYNLDKNFSGVANPSVYKIIP